MSSDETPKINVSIKHLYAKIKKMPELTARAKTIDQFLNPQLKEIKNTASLIIDQLNEQKKILLKRFDKWIMPIAQDVLENLMQEAHRLKSELEEKLEHLDETTQDEWHEQAQDWAKLYAKWQDSPLLVNKILEVVADRTKYLIDKDVKVIKDYQSQSIAGLSKKSKSFIDVEERLNLAIEEPLKQLYALRNGPQHTSLKEASEWIALLHEKREDYFDQLLIKIDHVIKEVVQPEEEEDLQEELIEWSSVAELEGELIFMERELAHIQKDIAEMDQESENDKVFIRNRIDGLLEHIDQLNPAHFPPILQQRMGKLRTAILSQAENLA